MYWELVHTDKINGFDISVYFAEEDYLPDWDFNNEEERLKLLEDIRAGNLLWFTAKVTASKCDVELTSDYLGGCCYASIQEFLDLKSDYGGMVHIVIQEAKRKIIELQF